MSGKINRKAVLKENYGTYNAYTVSGEKKAMIDIAPHTDADGFDCDYIVFTHTEPEYADILEKIIEKYPGTVIVGTATTIRNYKEILNRDLNEYTVKNASELDLGGAVLKFYIAPNLYQPDTMIVHEKAENALFTGLMYAGGEKEDGVPDSYYYHIKLEPFEEYVKTAQDIVKSVSPDTIYPYKGKNIYHKGQDYFYKFKEKKKKTASVYFYSHYGYTKMIAQALVDGMRSGGIETSVFDLYHDDDKMAEMVSALSADILMFGSPTLHRGAAKEIWDMISYIDTANTRGKIGLAFGSYGWSGEGVRVIEQLLRAARIKVYPEPQTAVYKPTEERLSEIRAFAEKMAAKCLEEK